jgi:hypothetical protein
MSLNSRPVIRADGETKTDAALGMWGLSRWCWSMHTQRVKRITFIFSGRSGDATTRFDIASCGAVFHLPIDCSRSHLVLCDVSKHSSSVPLVLFELWIGQKVTYVRICDANVHMGQLMNEVVFF